MNSNSLRKKYILLVYKLLHTKRDDLMIRRESLKKNLAIAALAGMLMLLLATPCFAQTPLQNSGQESCTNCNANDPRLQILDDTDLSNSSISLDLAPPELVSPFGIQNSGKLTYTWKGVSTSQSYCLVVKNDQNRFVVSAGVCTSKNLLQTLVNIILLR